DWSCGSGRKFFPGSATIFPTVRFIIFRRKTKKLRPDSVRCIREKCSRRPRSELARKLTKCFVASLGNLLGSAVQQNPAIFVPVSFEDRHNHGEATKLR